MGDIIKAEGKDTQWIILLIEDELGGGMSGGTTLTNHSKLIVTLFLRLSPKMA